MAANKDSFGPSPGKDAEDTGCGTVVGTDIVARLKANVASMRGQLRRLNEALARVEQIKGSVFERVQNLCGATDRLQHALDKTSPTPREKTSVDRREGAPSALKNLANPPPAERAFSDFRHVVAIGLSNHHIGALIAAGVLTPADVNNPLKVAGSIERLLDRWSGRLSAAGMGAREPLDALRAVERRSGLDRRRDRSQVTGVLRLIEGTTLDRRKGGDRRQASKRLSPRPVPYGPATDKADRPPMNLIRLADVRAARAEALKRGSGAPRPPHPEIGT